MLSNDNQNRNTSTSTIDNYVAQVNERRAKNLADRLVKCETNPDPREAPSPAGGIHIRRLVPMHVPVDKSAQEHNSAISSLGAGDEWLALWQR
jgi:hypothetical protein